MSVAPTVDVNASLWPDSQSLKKSIILQLLSRYDGGRTSGANLALHLVNIENN